MMGWKRVAERGGSQLGTGMARRVQAPTARRPVRWLAAPIVRAFSRHGMPVAVLKGFGTCGAERLRLAAVGSLELAPDVLAALDCREVGEQREQRHHGLERPS